VVLELGKEKAFKGGFFHDSFLTWSWSTKPFFALLDERGREREKGGERRIGKFNTISYHVIHAIPNKARSFCAKQSWNFINS